MVNALKCARNVWVSIFAAPGLIVALLERFSGHCADIRVSGSLPKLDHNRDAQWVEAGGGTANCYTLLVCTVRDSCHKAFFAPAARNGAAARPNASLAGSSVAGHRCKIIGTCLNAAAYSYSPSISLPV